MQKVLIVEDERIIGKAYELYLLNMHYDVIGVVSNREDTLKAIENNLPLIMLMDIQLKNDENGIEIVDEIRKKYNIPVIFTTGSSKEDIKDVVSEIPFSRLMIKPVNPTILFHVLQELLLESIEGNYIKINLEQE